MFEQTIVSIVLFAIPFKFHVILRIFHSVKTEKTTSNSAQINKTQVSSSNPQGKVECCFESLHRSKNTQKRECFCGFSVFSCSVSAAGVRSFFTAASLFCILLNWVKYFEAKKQHKTINYFIILCCSVITHFVNVWLLRAPQFFAAKSRKEEKNVERFLVWARTY